MFKNKKADLPITLLVVLVLMLCILASFTFLTVQNSYERNMQQVRVIPSTYAQEEAFIFYIKNIAYNIIRENPAISPENFVDSLQAQYEKDSVPEYNFPDIKKQILNDSKYKIEIKDNKLSFKLTNFEFSRSFYYDTSTKTYLFDYFVISTSPRQEAVKVKHTGDLVFEI